MTENEINNIIPANTWQGEYGHYTDEHQGSPGLNRFILMLIAAAMIPWLFGGYKIFGFNITGWAWVLPSIIAGLICLKNLRYITFPLKLWLLWIILLTTYYFFGRGNLDATQSFFQMLAPLLVGCAASTFRPDNSQMENIFRWITRLAIIAWILLLIRWPVVLSGHLPGHGFMAAEMIGLLLLGACYASFYACGSHRHLYYYLSMVAITLVALVRGPMIAMLSCLPFTLAPLGLRKRIAMIAVFLICGIVIFYTPRVQEMMFFSGSGKISDVQMSNPDFRTSGRSAMWDLMFKGIEESPCFGNGWNTHREVLLSSGFTLYLPHNDWLKLWHDIGAIGIGLYALTMLLQIFFLVRIARWSDGAHQMLAYGAATAFIPYMLIMLTDNVVLYVQFFGNLHFALIGIVYGAVNWDEGYANV